MEIYEKGVKEDIRFAKIFVLLLNALLVVDLFRMFIGNEIIVSIVQYIIYIGCAIYTYWQIVVCKKFKIDKYLFCFVCFLIFTIQ